MWKSLNSWGLFLLAIVGFTGCEHELNKTQELNGTRGIANRRKESECLGELIRLHHPDLDFKDVTSDAFDFLKEKRRSDYPKLFQADRERLSFANAEKNFPDYQIKEWMADIQTGYEDRLRFDLFWTKFGIGKKNPAQCDYLVLAESNDMIVAWKLFELDGDQ